jgi:hypothetical protein
MVDVSLIGDDQPIRLAVAARLAFPDGSMTVHGLRREFYKGNLAIEVIAGKHYTTLNDIKAMRVKCRENPKGRGCTGASRDRVDLDNGLSSMERLNAAQAAASMIGLRLKSSCKAT